MVYTAKTPIVQKLVKYFTENPEFQTAFEQSFALAYATGLDQFDQYNIHSVQGYLDFLDLFVHWVPTEDVSGRNVYFHICMFYFIIDLPPVRDHQSPIDPASKSPWRWLSEWVIEYAKDMGTWMDTSDSINDQSIQTFVDSPPYKFKDPEQPNLYPVPPDGWKTFNEFFARNINHKYRPVAGLTDPRVVVAPADAVFDGTWPVNEGTADVNTFDVKGVPWTISQLLDDPSSGTNYGPLFAGGTFTHSFLNTTDYHRQHAPVAGKVLEAKVIPGLCYLEVVLKAADPAHPTRGKPTLGMHRPILSKKEDGTIIPLHAAIRANPRAAPSASSGLVPDAPDSPGYQFIQARGLILIESEIGLVAVLPIGMAQVSSVVLSVKKGDVIEKGQEISYFQLGGSDIVMVFQKGANVQFQQEKNVHYNFGQQVATATPLVGN